MTAERTLHDLLAMQSELAVRLNRWVFLAAEPGDVTIAPSAAAARCARRRHPARDSIALVASPAATLAEVGGVLDEVVGRGARPCRIRLVAPGDQRDQVVLDAVRSAGFRSRSPRASNSSTATHRT